MQLYVRIQAAQCHCTTQVGAKPCAIVAESHLFSVLGGRGGRQQGWGPRSRGLLRTALCWGAGSGGRALCLRSQILIHSFKAFFPCKF